MKIKFAAFLVAFCGAAAAQSSSGYFFFAPGSDTGGNTIMTLHTGAGMDAVLAKGIAASLEIGVVGPRACFSDCYVGLFSPGAAYYFRRGKDNRLDPFVAGGYSVMFKPQSWGWPHANLFYFGGGANYWFSRKAGLRLEFRDHKWTETGGGRLGGFRFGLALR